MDLKGSNNFSFFEKYLRKEEKSQATIAKYLRDIRCFAHFLSGQSISKENTIAYKEYLCGKYAPASVNSILVALNGYLRFLKKSECCVKLLKVQRQIFLEKEKELTKAEYLRLLHTAKDRRLSFVLQTICGTGIRVSELRYITAEAVQKGRAVVSCKNKTRVIFIPVLLQKILQKYMKKNKIRSGSIFVSRNGRPLDRSNIWKEMKALCGKAHVCATKVFPHNLRHLFARTFYAVERDIVRLADLLGHSSINTTRIYTMETGEQHLNRLDRMKLVIST